MSVPPNKTYTPYGTKEKLNQSSKSGLRLGWMNKSELLNVRPMLGERDENADNSLNINPHVERRSPNAHFLEECSQIRIKVLPANNLYDDKGNEKIGRGVARWGNQ